MGRYTGSRSFSGHFSTHPLDDKVNTESLVQYLDEYLSIEGFPDYSHAYNGLQVEGPTEVRRVAVAVDSSEAVIREAASRDVDILIVHHGLFWDGLAKIVGPRFRKIRALIEGKVALYPWMRTQRLATARFSAGRSGGARRSGSEPIKAMTSGGRVKSTTSETRSWTMSERWWVVR